MPVWVYMNHKCGYMRRLEDTKLLGPGVTVGCEQVCGCREQNQGSLVVLLDLSHLTSYGKKSWVVLGISQTIFGSQFCIFFQTLPPLHFLIGVDKELQMCKTANVAWFSQSRASWRWHSVYQGLFYFTSCSSFPCIGKMKGKTAWSVLFFFLLT